MFAKQKIKVDVKLVVNVAISSTVKYTFDSQIGQDYNLGLFFCKKCYDRKGKNTDI